MQDGVKLERKTKDELKQIAQGLGIEKISALKKDEIIALIREKREQIANEEKQKVQPKKRERPADAVEVKGVLDVMVLVFFVWRTICRAKTIYMCHLHK
mgnify:CR=1 FL=1